MKDKLLDSILENTKNGQIIWYRNKSSFNSDSAHYYDCKLRDESLVKIYVNLNKDTLVFSYSDYVIVENKKLVDGKLFIHKYDNSKVTDIGELVYNMYIKPNITPRAQTQDQILIDIINSIPSKAESRDTKIREIIGDVSRAYPKLITPEIQKEIEKIDESKKNISIKTSPKNKSGLLNYLNNIFRGGSFFGK